MARALSLLVFLALALAKPLAVTTIAPYGSLVAEVLGEGWEVRVLVPAGANPHLYTPRPSDVRAVAGADLVVMNGLGLDDWLVEKLPVPDRARVLVAGEVLKAFLVPLPSGEPDPHVFSDLLAMSVFVCDVARAAGEVSGETLEYRQRAKKLEEGLLSLLARYRRKFEGLGSRAYVAYKNPFSYLNARFGLELAFLIGKTPASEPTPRELVAAKKVLAERGLDFIVAPYQLRREAERVAKNLGVRVVFVDLLGEEGGGYLETWENNLSRLYEAFSQAQKGE